MIRRFQAMNYKGLEMPELELGRINVFIGPNNCGKSNLFSAISFLFDMFGRPEETKGTLQAALARRRSGPLMTRGGGGEVGLSWALAPALRYGMSLLERAADDVIVASESVDGVLASESVDGNLAPNEFLPFWATLDAQGRLSWNQDGPWVGSHHPVEVLEVQEAGPSRSLIRAAFLRREGQGQKQDPVRAGEDSYLRLVLWHAEERLRTVATSSLRLQLASLVPSDIAAPKSSAKVQGLDDRGVHLVNLLQQWLVAPSARARLVEECAAMIPGLDGVEVVEGGGYRWIRLSIRGAWRNLSEMSDGTVTMLTLGALLFLASESRTLLLDEPELNLHPAWARVIATWLIRQQAWEQLLVSTHSPEILDPLTEHFQRGEVRLFVFQRSGDGFRVEPCPPERVASRLSEGWQLGDLYRVGEPALGGWPW